VPVLVNEQRKKLSKRRDKVALEQYRDEGYLADAMVNYLMTLGWAPKARLRDQPWSAMEPAFRLEDVNHSPAFFDLKKLAAFNGEYIRMLAVDELAARATRGCPPTGTVSRSRRMVPYIQERLKTLAEAPAAVDFLFWPSGADVPFDPESWQKAFAPSGPPRCSTT
jgi:glutamyl-tRNA synthetase